MLDPGGGAELVEGDHAGARLVGHPGLEVVARGLQRADRTEHVVHQREQLGPPAEVVAHRRAQRVAVLHEHIDDALQARAALRGGDRPLAQESLTL